MSTLQRTDEPSLEMFRLQIANLTQRQCLHKLKMVNQILDDLGDHTDTYAQMKQLLICRLEQLNPPSTRDNHTEEKTTK